MQDRYVGDIGDFANNGLLRWLTGMTGPELPDKKKLQLGVVWYLHPDEKDKRDGKKVDYLKDTPGNFGGFRKCDYDLYYVLQRLVKFPNRTIRALRRSGILPINALFYEECLTYAEKDTRLGREGKRKKWLDDALEATKEAQLVFVDPDNGIACSCASPFIKTGPKYVYMDDLRCFVEKGKSLVIYHHLTRRHGTAEEEIRHFSRCLEKKLGLPVYALRYNRGVTRFHFIVAQIEHNSIILERLRCFKKSKWCAELKPLFPTPHFCIETEFPT